VSIATPFAVLGAVFFYAITGAISSAPFIVLYNATSRFWPAVTATFEPGKPPAESAQQPPPAQSGAAPTR
jgi:hypothetical protein